uniref:Dehydrogenase/reductase SDR family member on chromosome X homolog isoform X2 n=1 Tax=Rhizophora mucronata TaxID=61149 RepID=A0A2P2KRA8_RHIMU
MRAYGYCLDPTKHCPVIVLSLICISDTARCVNEVMFTIREPTGLLLRSGNRSLVRQNAPM